MARFRKKPVVIEAFRLGIDYIPDWFMDKVTTNDIILHGTSSGFEHHNDTNADIKTLEGWHHANFGDFIIKGTAGEIYPCKPHIFKDIYESADTTADVAPRSEVAVEVIDEAIRAVYLKTDMKIYNTIDGKPLGDGVAFGKQQAMYEVISLLAELKKKYMEGNDG